MADCPQHDDLFEYALAGLEEDRKEKVREHLGLCKGCREQIRDYALVTEGLALGVEEREPPAGLENAVKARIRRDRELAAAPPRPALAGWAGFWMRLGPVFAGMSLVMTAVAVLALQGRTQFSAGSAGQGGRENLLRLASMFTAPDTTVVALKAMGKDKKCKGKIFCSKDGRFVVVSVENLEPCPLGRTYTVWRRGASGDVVHLGDFMPKDGSPHTAVMEAPGVLAGDDPVSIEVWLQYAEEAKQGPGGELRLAGRAEI